MRILFDHQTFSQQDYGGISRYFCEMMIRFSKDPSIDFTLALRYSQNENLHLYSQLNTYWSQRNNFFSDNGFFSFLQKKIHFNALNYIFNNQQESERLLKKHEFDVFHPTYYNPYFIRYLQGKPYILTVHDMIHEVYPDDFSENDPAKLWKKQCIENASAIIAISENTKCDIIEYTTVEPEKIQVVYHGNPFENEHEPMKTITSTTPITEGGSYLLFVGTRSGYKNFIFFIESISGLLLRNADLQLYCAGGGPFTGKEKKIMQKLNVIDKVQFVQTNNHRMKYLYQNARAFVFPSLYEGFGLPVLEAFSCGCPVILSNTSSLPEVGGDAALYFDPHDSESLTDAVDRLLSDDNLRKHLIRNGNERLKLFSWEKTAKTTKIVYNKVVNQ
jgi:glycosyltransferase involved in cell wall biosynthesis